MDFPIQDLMNEDACYQFLLDLYHPAGLCCPRCHAPKVSTRIARSVSPSRIIVALGAAGSSTPGPGPISRALSGGPRKSS